MKRITIFIIAAIISFNLSACGKTKQLLQPDPGIEKQQAGSDTTDYKKLYENECSVSSVRKYINWGLGVVASVAVLVSLHFADKAIYSKIMANAAKKTEIAYDTYYLQANPAQFSPNDDNNILSQYETAFKANYDFGCIATNSSDKDLALSTFDTLKNISSTDNKLNPDQKNLVEGYADKYQIVEIQSILPYRNLRTAGWNLIKSKFMGRNK